MGVELGPITVIGEDEAEPATPYVRLLPFPAVSPHFFPWWDASTRACLEALGAADLAGLHVVDFGCGSSAILAIAAARLGAAKVTAVERQADLVEVALRQVEANGLAGDIAVICGDQPPQCDLLVANLGDALAVGSVSRLAPRGFGTDNEGAIIAW